MDLHVSVILVLGPCAWPKVLFLIVQTVPVLMVRTWHVVRQNESVHVKMNLFPMP